MQFAVHVRPTYTKLLKKKILLLPFKHFAPPGNEAFVLGDSTELRFVCSLGLFFRRRVIIEERVAEIFEIIGR